MESPVGALSAAPVPGTPERNNHYIDTLRSVPTEQICTHTHNKSQIRVWPAVGVTAWRGADAAGAESRAAPESCKEDCRGGDEARRKTRESMIVPPDHNPPSPPDTAVPGPAVSRPGGDAP
ncbi:hypothetical protein L3Q82_005604 [Scortum barcoo]|uniref:Uncharacterized protein n=1 Tax=Scortum barcoo TaxID=214431 RepID=A0ACB8V6P1_9TELE|nr:hypothetical protein L3Q82_005604 [Scortum barcoo]